MSSVRSIKRNIIKKAQGNNRIRKRWRIAQIKKFGLEKWCKIYNKCNRKSRANYLEPEDALKI
ncbi:MAG: hypothetical protein IJX99_06455 [Clostridia bacterium]|nr:hypothetical protein [Clostridia bacterium]